MNGTRSQLTTVNKTRIISIKYMSFIYNLLVLTTPRPCEDDPSTNCSRVSALVNICSNRQEAKQLCPKYCGLCNQGIVYAMRFHFFKLITAVVSQVLVFCNVILFYLYYCLSDGNIFNLQMSRSKSNHTVSTIFYRKVRHRLAENTSRV